MNPNIFRPSKAVKSAFEKPSWGFALLLVLLPGILAAAFTIVLGFAFNLIGTAYGIAINIIRFFVIAAIIYILAYVLRGKEKAGGKFSGLASALSLLWLVAAILVVVGSASIPFMVSPAIMQGLQQLSKGAVSPQQFAAAIAPELEGFAGINLVCLGLLLIAAAVLIILWLLIYYFAVKEMFQFGTLGNIVMWLILIFVFGLTAAFLPL